MIHRFLHKLLVQLRKAKLYVSFDVKKPPDCFFCYMISSIMGVTVSLRVGPPAARFTIVPPQPQNTFGHVLYLIHRASLLGPPKVGDDDGRWIWLCLRIWVFKIPLVSYPNQQTSSAVCGCAHL